MPTARAWLGLALASIASGQTPELLPPFSVTATRSSRAPEEQPFAIRTFTRSELTRELSLDRALRADPGFSLFRRSDSLSANPTAQGVSLRGIGPSGASRSLVLLDGVPLNDPFGGWVAWNQIPTTALQSVEIAHGGGAGAWGNAALGGTLALATASPASGGGAFSFEAAAHDTWLAEFSANAGAAGGTTLRLDARAFSTGGHHPLAAADRGAVDQPLASDHHALQARAQRSFGRTEATLTLRRYDDERSNGTRGQNNATRMEIATLSLRGAPAPDREWQFATYLQSQSFRSAFTTVSLDRASETPANDQFSVPATAAGAAYSVEWRDAGMRTSAGTDFRQIRGETREDFLYTGGDFTRRRHAGGRQVFTGAFLTHERPFDRAWRGLLSLRGDWWQLSDGERREVVRATGSAVRTDRHPDRSDFAASANVGIVWNPSSPWRVRATAQRAFRVPTLNELHRPFRVGNANTEANPALLPETLLGAEIGVEHRTDRLTSAITVFANQLDDAIGNVTLSSTPTLISRERRNIDRVFVQGAELRATWQATAVAAIELAAMRSDSEVTRFAAQPALVGKRLAQAPRHIVTARARAEVARGWEFQALGRWADRQFEDDENALTLGAAAALDVRLSGRVTEHSTLTLSLDNATDSAVPVARSANGLTSYAAPRTWRIRWSASW